MAGRDAAAFGTPAWAIPVLPWFELVLGAVLISGLARPVAAALAAAVLLAFTAPPGRQPGPRAPGPPCACFGARSRRPIGAWTVVRNLVAAPVAPLA